MGDYQMKLEGNKKDSSESDKKKHQELFECQREREGLQN